VPQNLYSERQIAMIRESGRLAAQCLQIIREMIKPGVTTLQMDQKVTDFIVSQGCRSPFKNYRFPGKTPFPASLCASVNDVVVHGVPDKTPLKAGDIVSIDVGVVKDGFIGDTAWTFCVGEPDEKARKLLAVGEKSLYEGIEAMKPRGVLADVSRAIQNYVETNGFSVVREYVGHGVGLSLHEEPQVKNYVEMKDFLPGFRTILKPGTVIAVEPMVNEGTPEVESEGNEWPVRTKDHGRSVHFEHTIAVLEDRVEILTKL
jgi:methionyl aminopeptidase